MVHRNYFDMKKITFFLLFLSGTLTWAQQTSTLYNPMADAKKDIAEAIEKAQKEQKHVWIQVGGNWCPWCVKLDQFIANNDSIGTFLHSNFVSYHLNYSKENKNEELLARYRYPQRFGFPVWLILDAQGNLIHTQNSAYMEEGKGYNPSIVMEVLKHWSPAALDPKTYEKK